MPSGFLQFIQYIFFINAIHTIDYSFKYDDYFSYSSWDDYFVCQYYKTMRTINRRVSSMDSAVMQSTITQSKTLVNVALSISICTLVLLTPHIIGEIILEVRSSYQAQNRTELAIFKWFTYLAALGNGVCSCAILVLYNRPVKIFIIREIMHNQ